ncbi:hypothetical protein HK096_003778 [Nowakowskiella sp. JEL0078]|nr:hypothetical protein HK096_003778 [Nowakowskiella sp. JEL0078]
MKLSRVFVTFGSAVFLRNFVVSFFIKDLTNVYSTAIFAKAGDSLISFDVPCFNNHKIAINTGTTENIRFSLAKKLPFNISLSLQIPTDSPLPATFSALSVNLSESGKYKNITITGNSVGYFSTSFQLTTMGNVSSEFIESLESTKELLATTVSVHVIDGSNKVRNIILLGGTVLFGFSIGCSFPFPTIRNLFQKQRAKGVAAATLSQFIFVPLAAFLLVRVFKLSTELAVGAVLVASSPGGSIAPVFTYFMGGDMALSVSIGIISTCLANALIPVILSLCALLYPQIWSQIPWLALGLTLLGLLVPLFLGMLTLHYKPIWGYYISRTTTFWGALVVICSVIIGVLSWKEMFLSNWEVYITAIIVGIVSLAGGTILSLSFRLSPFELRAVIMQTSLQNTPLALSIIQLAFPNSCAPLVQLFPLFYTLWMIFMATVVCVVCFYIFPVIHEPETVLSPENFQCTVNNFNSIHAPNSPEMNMVSVGPNKLKVDNSIDRVIQNVQKKSIESSDEQNMGTLVSHVLSVETPPAEYATTSISGFGNFSLVPLQKSLEAESESQSYQTKYDILPKPNQSVESFSKVEQTAKSASIMDWFSMIPWTWITSTEPSTNPLQAGSAGIPDLALDSKVIKITNLVTSEEFTIVDAIDDEEEDNKSVHYSTHCHDIKFVDVPSVKTMKTCSSDDESAWESAEEYADSILSPENERTPMPPSLHLVLPEIIVSPPS